MSVLEGVGVKSRQWEEWTGTAFHLRRRLTNGEQAAIGEAVDIRFTEEAIARALQMGPMLSRIPDEMLREELRLT